MSSEELDRLQVLVRVSERRLTQREATRILGVTERQLRRLWSANRQEGAAGLASRQRGRRSSHRQPDAMRERALALVRQHRRDFGPTFAHEKLSELHGLELSVSTLRTWMTQAGLWVPRKTMPWREPSPKRRRAHPGRPAS